MEYKAVIDLRVFIDKFVSQLQCESRLLYPYPKHYIFAEDALNALVEAGADKITLSMLVDTAKKRDLGIE